MSQEVFNPIEPEKRTKATIVLRAMLAFGYIFVLFIVVMFLPGGIRWTKGWVFVTVFLVETAIAIPYLWRKNPAIFVARSRIQKGIKPWDRVVMCFLFLSILAVFVVAALDDGRFHWSSAPTWLAVVGYIPFSMGFFLTAWAESVNPFAEPGVRIQTERGHKVVDSGPYAIVRHPMYLSALFLVLWCCPSVGFVLGFDPSHPRGFDPRCPNRLGGSNSSERA